MLKNRRNSRLFYLPLGLGVSLVTCLSLLLLAGSSLPAFAQGPFLFGATHQGQDGPSTLHTIDPLTGAPSVVGPITGFERVQGMDTAMDGTLFAIAERDDGSDTNVLITIDPDTGAGTEVGPTGLGTGMGVSFRNSDNVLFIDYWGEGTVLATVNTQTGAGTDVGPTGTFGDGNGIAFSPGDELYHAEKGRFSLHTLNQSTGEATYVTELFYPGGLNWPRINAMDFQPGTGVLFASLNDGEEGSGPNYLATVDTGTGEVTIIGQTVDGLAALAFWKEVPAPPSEVIVGGTLAGENWLEILVPWLIMGIAFTVGGIILIRRKAIA